MGTALSSHFQPQQRSLQQQNLDNDLPQIISINQEQRQQQRWDDDGKEIKQEGDEQEQQMPRLSQAQMRALIRSGMKPDLCLMPYQMPRMDNGDDLSPIPSKPRPTIRIKNDLNLHKTTVSFIRDEEFPSRYAISFKFDCMCETDVTVYYCVTEVVDERNTSIRFVPSSPNLVSTARYGAGKSHHYIQTLEESLDTTNLTEQQLKYQPASRYWPIIIHLQATHPHEPALRPSSDLDHKSPSSSLHLAHSTSIEQLYSQLNDPINEQIHARSQTTFAQMGRTGANHAIQVKVVKQKIKVSGQSYELQEIYGMEAKNDENNAGAVDGTGARAVSPEADAGNQDIGMAEAQECVVCMTEPRDTTIFPCRHMCLCAPCAEIVRVQTNRCPICRCVVQSLFKMPTLVSSHSVENLSNQRRSTSSTPAIATSTSTSTTTTSPIAEERDLTSVEIER